MRYRRLGKSGLIVTELALGCMTFGNEADERTAGDIVRCYLDAGGNFFDTADCYHAGRSEKIVGDLVRGNRDNVVLASKVGLRVGDRPNEIGASAKHIARSIARTLRNLRTDHLDIYQVHCWDPATPVEETVAALEDVLRRGQARYVGVSNFAGWQLVAMASEARAAGFPLVSVQQQYSLVERDIEAEAVPAARHVGSTVLVWGPLGGGFLSGKYDRTRPPPPDSRLGKSVDWMEEYWERRAVERNWVILDEVRSVAKETGRTCAQVAIAWVTEQSDVTSAIIGASTLDQAVDNLGAAGSWLDPEHLERLDAVSRLPSRYPQRFQEVAMSSRLDTSIGASVGLR